MTHRLGAGNAFGASGKNLAAAAGSVPPNNSFQNETNASQGCIETDLMRWRGAAQASKASKTHEMPSKN